MAMQSNATAGRRIINWDDRAVSVAAVVASRAECGGHILRAVIQRVRIKRMQDERTRASFRIWTHTHALVVDTRGDAAADRRSPVLAVIITDVRQRIAAGKLRRPNSASIRISEQDRIGGCFVTNAGWRVFKF